MTRQRPATLWRSRVPARLVCAAALCALGCSERPHLSAAQPHASIDPLALDFGSTPLLFPVQRTIAVVDGGAVALHIADLAVIGSGFEVAPAPLRIEPGTLSQVKITFRPRSQGTSTGALTFTTDDPDVPFVNVALSGEGTAAGALAVSPLFLDFGRVGEGQTAVRALSLASVGTMDLYLGTIGFSDGTPAAFDYVGSVRAPATVPAGNAVQLSVRFSPTPATQVASGAAVVESSDPQHEHVEVPLTAAINRAPIALALGSVNGGPAQSGSLDAAVGATVALDATSSHDPDGDLPLSYAWTLATRPTGSAAAIQNPAAPHATVTLDQPGVYSATLVAIDGTGLPSLVPSRLDLRATPAEHLVVQLVWDQVAPDLDLHLLLPGAAQGSAGDCGWTNPDPAWYPGGADKNPHHLGDKLTGYGPETVSWKDPTAGKYTIAVVYKASHGQTAPTTAQLRVYTFGVLTADLSRVLRQEGEVWTAGTVDWPSGAVAAGP